MRLIEDLMNTAICQLILMILVYLVFLSGCTNQPVMVDPISSGSPTTSVTPFVTDNKIPEVTQTFQIATPKSGKITDTPIPLVIDNTPTNSKHVQTEVSGLGNLIYLFSRDLGSVYFFLNPFEKGNNNWLEPDNIRNLQDASGQVKTISFSFNGNRIAYQKSNGEIWISDLMINKPIKLVDMSAGNETGSNLIWTPDDIHLIIDNVDPNQPDLIYEINSGKLETWNRTCNQLVLSPRTKQLAVGCWSKDDNQYAYIEWGGEIWVTKNPPDKIVFKFDLEEPKNMDPNLRTLSIGMKYLPFSFHLVAGWSPDGKRVAYYDPQDHLNSLIILNSDGEIENRIPHKAYWQVSTDGSYDSLPGLPIQWSGNGRMLLLYGKGSEKAQCSSSKSENNNQPQLSNNHNCWQVIDSEKWETQWYPSNLLSDNPIVYENASLSEDGNELAMNSFYPSGNKFQVIDISNSNIILDTPLSVSDFRWERP